MEAHCLIEIALLTSTEIMLLFCVLFFVLFCVCPILLELSDIDVWNEAYFTSFFDDFNFIIFYDYFHLCASHVSRLTRSRLLSLSFRKNPAEDYLKYESTITNKSLLI